MYQGRRLPGKNYQGYCDLTTKTQATIVWFPEDTFTTFQVAEIFARLIKFHQNYPLESVPSDNINPNRIRSKPENIEL